MIPLVASPSGRHIGHQRNGGPQRSSQSQAATLAFEAFVDAELELGWSLQSASVYPQCRLKSVVASLCEQVASRVVLPGGGLLAAS